MCRSTTINAFFPQKVSHFFQSSQPKNMSKTQAMLWQPPKLHQQNGPNIFINQQFNLLITANSFPVMKTGVPAMRTRVPCNKNRLFPVWKTSQGKPCSGPVLALYGITVQSRLQITLIVIFYLTEKDVYLHIFVNWICRFMFVCF